MEYYSKELGQKNFQALSQGLKDLRSQLSQEQKDKENLKQQLAIMQQQVDIMSSRLNVVFAKSMGNGVTS